MLVPPSVLAALFFLVLLALVLAPVRSLSSSVAQPPPPPPPSPVVHVSDESFRGWSPVRFAFHPTTPSLMFVLDGGRQVVAVNTSDGRELYSSDLYHQELDILDLAVDSSGLVYVVTTDDSEALLLQLDSTLRTQRTVRLSTLKPPCFASQLAMDSKDLLYLTVGGPISYSNPTYDTTVWVMRASDLVQIDAWQAKVPRFSAGDVNFTSYLMAIDPTNTLYFQQTAGQRRTFLSTQGGDSLQTLDILSSRLRSTAPLSDLVIDSALVMHVVQAGSALVERYDQASGRWLTPFAVLSGLLTARFGPQLAISPVSHVLYVIDPADHSIIVITPDGEIGRELYSPSGQATWSYGQLTHDPFTGDLISFNRYGGLLAQRVSARDGSLLQEYLLPARLQGESSECQYPAGDVGQRDGLLYFALECQRRTSEVTLRIHVQYPNGRLRSEFLVQGYDGEGLQSMAVDEFGQRLYLNTVRFYPFNGTIYAGTLLRVVDFQGHMLYNITGVGNESWRFVNDISVSPGPAGGQLLVLESTGRVTGIERNGSIAFFHRYPTSGRESFVNIEWADDSSVYLGVTSLVRDFNGTGIPRWNGSIYRLNHQEQVTEQYKAAPSEDWEVDDFNYIASTDQGLFAYSYGPNAVHVWRRRGDHSDPKDEAKSEEGREMEMAVRERLQRSQQTMGSTRSTSPRPDQRVGRGRGGGRWLMSIEGELISGGQQQRRALMG